MTPFRYERAATVANALDAGARPDAAFLAGGTNLVDLMRYGIEAPTALVDTTRLRLVQVGPLPGGACGSAPWSATPTWLSTRISGPTSPCCRRRC